MTGWARGAALAVGLALAGCGGTGAPPRSAGAAPASAPATAREVDAIAALLDAGDAKAARKRIAGALKGDPMNPALMLLRDSLDRDPVELLGPTHHPYTVRAGDTMPALAERFLGNRLKAYQLARYNGLDGPVDLPPGRVLRIPGDAPAPVAAERARRDEGGRPARRRPDAPPKPALAASKVKPAPPKPAAAALAAPAPAADPGAARAARSAGLQALNQGQVGRAIDLLRRAARLDPANPVARRDLARAERIASAVRARR